MYFSRSLSALPILLLAVTAALCAQVKGTGSGPVASVGGQQASNAQSTVKEPEIPSQVQTLSGQLVYHDGIRKWFELKLDRAQSGQGSIQLVWEGEAWKQMQVLRGCRVRSTGPVFLSPTDPYYSLDTTQTVQHIESVETCTLKPPIQVDANGKPDKNIHDYQVDMRVNYSPGDHPVVFRVTSAGKELQPWQAYASYGLLDRFVLYGQCGEGFVIDKVFGTPQATPSHVFQHSNDMAMFNSEGAVSSGKTDMQLGYTCIRKPKPNKNIHDYQVDMRVNYSPGDHPVVLRVTSAGKELQPWQTYASYALPGRFVLYGVCGEGFVIDKVFGTPQATPSHVSQHSNDMAMFNSEGAVSSGKTDMHLGYTCIRKPSVPSE